MRFNRYLISEASDRTSLQEGLHCIAFGIGQVIRKKKITMENLQDPELFHQSFQDFCNIDAPYNLLWEFNLAEESWRKSVITSSNTLRATNWLKGFKYKFYRGTSLMNNIYNLYNKLKKSEGIKMANDKWNPSDIWASTISTIPNFNTLTEFNSFISEKLRVRSLVGISLKKVGKSAKVLLQGPSEKPEIIGYKIIKKPKEIFPTGMVIQTSKGNIMIIFRSFRISKQADITGEIIQKGGLARHGKVPTSVKKKMIEKYKIPQLEKGRIKNIIDKGGINELINMCVNLWKQCGYNFPANKIENDWKIRLDKGIQDEIGYWQSIIHALELGAFLNTHKGVADEIVYNFYIGAASISDMSSEFIKVS